MALPHKRDGVHCLQPRNEGGAVQLQSSLELPTVRPIQLVSKTCVCYLGLERRRENPEASAAETHRQSVTQLNKLTKLGEKIDEKEAVPK